MIHKTRKLSIIGLILFLVGILLLFTLPSILGIPGITDTTNHSAENLIVSIGQGLFILTTPFILFIWVVYLDQKRRKM